MKIILLILLLCAWTSPAVSEVSISLPENPQRTNGLVLNTIVLYDAAQTWKSGFIPKNAVENLGSQGTGRMTLYTAYISTNLQDAGEHIQKIELYSPGRKKLVYTSGKKFLVQQLTPSRGAFQRGYLEHTVVFPALSPADSGSFGLYVLAVYLNDTWVRDFLVPVFSR